MAKKRKSIATTLDEVDRTMYASFCSAANSLSQLHMQALNHQKLSFQAGQRHGLVILDYYSFHFQLSKPFYDVYVVFSLLILLH